MQSAPRSRVPVILRSLPRILSRFSDRLWHSRQSICIESVLASSVPLHMVAIGCLDVGIAQQLIDAMRSASHSISGSETINMLNRTVSDKEARSITRTIIESQSSKRIQRLVELIVNAVEHSKSEVRVKSTRRGIEVVNDCGMSLEDVFQVFLPITVSSKENESTLGRFGLGFNQSLGGRKGNCKLATVETIANGERTTLEYYLINGEYRLVSSVSPVQDKGKQQTRISIPFTFGLSQRQIAKVVYRFKYADRKVFFNGKLVTSHLPEGIEIGGATLHFVKGEKAILLNGMPISFESSKRLDDGFIIYLPAKTKVPIDKSSIEINPESICIIARAIKEIIFNYGNGKHLKYSFEMFSGSGETIAILRKFVASLSEQQTEDFIFFLTNGLAKVAVSSYYFSVAKRVAFNSIRMEFLRHKILFLGPEECLNLGLKCKSNILDSCLYFVDPKTGEKERLFLLTGIPEHMFIVCAMDGKLLLFTSDQPSVALANEQLLIEIGERRWQ